jgi:hypothetical protein
MMKLRLTILLFAFLGPLAAQTEELKVPLWVSSRPNSSSKFIGIGFAEKARGGNYQMEAKKNALYDLASEIKVDISSNSVLYTVQNNSGFNENFNSLIKLSNSDNLEGYTLVESYENDKQYWVHYQLDKHEYASRKAMKKKAVIDKASALIASSFADEKAQDFSSSLKKRIQAFGLLTPYLSEEINFEPVQAGGMKNIFDLTSLIQQQLQSISVAPKKEMPVLKPYQLRYDPLLYKLEVNAKTPLQNFPLIVSSDEEQLNVADHSITNGSGELQLRVNSVEPLNQTVGFSLSPDITSLMGTDSVGRAGVTILKQFIQTPALKVHANITSITIYVNAVEKNFGQVTGESTVENFIKQRFSGREIRLVATPEEADYIIESTAQTKEDVSSDVLERTYRIHLAALLIDLQLKNRITSEVLFKTQVNDIYGYANTPEKAGLNAYQNPRLNGKLAESVFFLKRKILVY